MAVHTHDVTLDLFRRDKVCARVRDERLEVRAGLHVFQVRLCLWVPQKGFGEEDDEAAGGTQSKRTISTSAFRVRYWTKQEKLWTTHGFRKSRWICLRRT